jgi:hypothetical protein
LFGEANPVAFATYNPKRVNNRQFVNEEMAKPLNIQRIVDEELLSILAEETKGEEHWQLNQVHARLKQRFTETKPGFEVLASHALRSEQKLSREGFIEIRVPEANNKEPVIALTLLGLLRRLETLFSETTPDETIKEHLDKLAINQGRKLLPFMFSPYLNNPKMGQKVLSSYFKLMPKSLYHKSIDFHTAIGFERLNRWETEKMLRDSFYDFILLVNNDNHSFTDEEVEKWSQALASDEEARKYAIKRLCLYRDRYVPKVQKANQRIMYLENNQ